MLVRATDRPRFSSARASNCCGTLRKSR